MSSISNDVTSDTVLEAKHNKDKKEDKTDDNQTGSQNPIIQSSTVTKNKRTVVLKNMEKTAVQVKVEKEPSTTGRYPKVLLRHHESTILILHMTISIILT